MTREYYRHHVFLSYSRSDTDMMHRVRDGLRAAGLLVWTDDTGLEPGTPSWEAAIQEAIREAGCMVVLLSPDAMESEWVTRESAFADTWDLRIFPVLVRGNERNAVPLRLTSHQRIDARRDVDGATRTLVASILRHLTIEPLDTLHPPPKPVMPRRRLPRLTWIGEVVVGLALLIGIGALAQSVFFGGGPTAEVAGGDSEPSEEIDIHTLASGEVVRNGDWEPVIQDIDGVQMALVPAGCFMMGSSEEEIDFALVLCGAYFDSCEREPYEVEAPHHEVCFNAPFWIDIYEVTNAQYGSSGSYSSDDLPREMVDWFGAAAHCEGRGARLPTEAEWEYAARGPDGLVFPWGNAFDGALTNYCDANCILEHADTYGDDGYRYTAPVGSYPGDVSWVGAYDMSGNVEEWVNSIYEPYPYSATDGREVDSSMRVVRGGGWHATAIGIRAASRWGNTTDVSSSYLGFRCARDFDPAD